MPLVRDRCICLRKVEYSETSQILLLFGREHGLVRVIAKGAHRTTKAGASKFGGGIDLLDVADAVFTHDPGRELGTLTEWRLLEGHLDLRRSLRGVYLAQYAAEMVAALFEEHDPHPDVLADLEQALGDLATPRQEEAFILFELNLLRSAGYLADLDVCASCGRPTSQSAAAWFSAAAGGMVCRDCEQTTHDRMPLDPRLVRLMQGLMRLGPEQAQRLPRLTRHQTDPINRLLAEYVQYNLGRRLRVARYVLPGTSARSAGGYDPTPDSQRR